MTQQDKQLILQDLCARLPYSTIVYNEVISKACELISIDTKTKKGEEIVTCKILTSSEVSVRIENIKPYLRNLISITPREKSSLQDAVNMRFVEKYCAGKESLYVGNLNVRELNNIYDWLNAHHFDYRGLIEKGLAIEVTPENDPYK